MATDGTYEKDSALCGFHSVFIVNEGEKFVKPWLGLDKIYEVFYNKNIPRRISKGGEDTEYIAKVETVRQSVFDAIQVVHHDRNTHQAR